MNDVSKNSFDEAQNHGIVLGVFLDSPCLRHKTKKLRYLQWHDWAEKKIKKGATQKQCSKCGSWYFKDEF